MDGLPIPDLPACTFTTLLVSYDKQEEQKS
jgi:hypothetical protein